MSDRRGAQYAEKGSTRGRFQRLAVLMLVAINLFILGGIWFLAQGGAPERTPSVLVLEEGFGLRDAYDRALLVATHWQRDAQLVGATTSWQMATGDQLTLQRPAWSFSFFSPIAQRVQIVTVDKNGAQPGRQQLVGSQPIRVAPDWGLESDELLLTFLSYGGKTFVGSHPIANIHLQLKGEKNGNAVWYITGVDPVARRTVLVGVDANTRDVVFSSSSEGGA